MNTKNIVTSVVAALLVSFAAILAMVPSEAHITDIAVQAAQSVGAATASGGVHNAIEQWVNGLMPGDQNEFWKSGTIEPGANQAVWTNKTGRTVYVRPGDTSITWTTGNASSSLIFYAATSTATSLSNNFATPAGLLLLSGATTATSTGPQTLTGTSTANGYNGTVAIPGGSSLIYQIQSLNGGLCNGGGCEAATSTNRGITRFLWTFKGRYQP